MDRCTPSPSTYVGPERRAHPRIPAAAVPHLTARVAGGPPARLIDLSKRGVQIETTMYMCPGSTVAMRFLCGDASVTLTGAVVRSTVAVLESRGEVTYHSALAFTDELTLGGEDLAAAAAAAATVAPPAHTGQAVSSDYTMIVMDGRTGTLERAEATPAC